MGIPWYRKEKKTNQRHFLTTNSEEELISNLMKKHDCNFTDLMLKGIKTLEKVDEINEK